MTKRTVILTAALLAMSATFADTAFSAETKTAAPAATEAPTAAPAAGYTCGDPLGCVELGPGDPIKFGYALVTAGPNATLGQDSVRGMEIAADDMGNELLGHPIEIVGEDSGCSPEGGQAAATKLASDTSLVGIVGTSCSSEARVGIPILTEAGLSMISPSNTAPDLTDPAKHIYGYFRTAHNDKVQGRVAAEFVYNELKLTKAATIHDGSVYAQGLVNAFTENFEKLGGKVVSAQAVNAGDTDMRPVLTTIAAAGPEIVYYPIFVAEGGFITSQIREVPGLETVKTMGSDGIFSPDFIKAAGENVVGMYLSSPDFSAFGDAYQTFLKEHQAKYGEPPVSAFHAHAYDATNVFAAAIQKVAVQDGDKLYIPRTALRDTIAATKDFKGLTGNITCDPNGDCADPKIAVYEVKSATDWNPNVTSPMKIYPEAAAAAMTGPQMVDTYTCDDPLGCVEIAAGDPIKFGYALVTAGPNATLGQDSVRGMEIAADDMGNELLGHPIEIVGEDSGCSPEGGQAAATKLASDTSLVGIVGTSCSSEARVGIPILTEAGLSMISPSNTAPDLTDPAKHIYGYFRTAHNDKVQGRVAAEFVYNELKLTKAATIHDGSVYAQGLVNAFTENFEKLGGKVVSAQAVNAGDTDMRPVLTTIAAAGPEIVYYPIFVAEGGFITSQIREVPGLETVKTMGSDGIFSPDFIKAAGENVVGMYLSSPDFSAFGDAYQTFLKEHQAKYGEPPVSAFHAHAYDATNVFAAAIQKVAVQDGDKLYIPRTALRDTIAATKDFKGLTGNITCDPNGDCADPKIAVYEVKSATDWNPNVTSPMKIYPK